MNKLVAWAGVLEPEKLVEPMRRRARQAATALLISLSLTGCARDNPDTVSFTAPAAQSGHLVIAADEVRFVPCRDEGGGVALDERVSDEASGLISEFGVRDSIPAMVRVENERATDIRYAGPEGRRCEELPPEGTLEAYGNEPFWIVSIRNTNAVVKTPEQPNGIEYGEGRWTRPDSSTWHFEAVGEDKEIGSSLVLHLTEKDCRDSMSGALYPFQAVFSWNGHEELRGCGLEGREAAASEVAKMQVLDVPGGHVAMLVLYVALALVFSFLCSVAEAVLLSVTPSYIQSMKSKRPKRAALLKRLKQKNIDRSLAAILTLNTIAHTVGAIGAGAEAVVVFGSAWFGLFSAVMTLMILFLSEIVPKTIGVVYWARLAGPVATFVQMLIVVLYPAVWISEGLTKMIAGKKALHVFSREEFIAMALVGQETGQLEAKESRIIQNLFRLKSLRVTDIMTPRTVIMALPESMLISDALALVTDSPFSRLPIYGTDIDDVTGFVLKDDILIRNAQGEGEEDLGALKRRILAVPESVSLSILLERFLADRQQIARVVDEYGGTRGVVTLEDLVETLMGLEIIDESDNVADMRVMARKQWVQRAEALGVDVDLVEQS